MWSAAPLIGTTAPGARSRPGSKRPPGPQRSARQSCSSILRLVLCVPASRRFKVWWLRPKRFAISFCVIAGLKASQNPLRAAFGNQQKTKLYASTIGAVAKNIFCDEPLRILRRRVGLGLAARASPAPSSSWAWSQGGAGRCPRSSHRPRSARGRPERDLEPRPQVRRKSIKIGEHRGVRDADHS